MKKMRGGGLMKMMKKLGGMKGLGF
jgi:hypothetical protein